MAGRVFLSKKYRLRQKFLHTSPNEREPLYTKGMRMGRCLNNTSPSETPCTSAFQKVWGGMEVFFEKKKKGKRKKAKNESYAFGGRKQPF